MEYKRIEIKLGECEKNNALLRQRIAELEALLGDESAKRSKHANDLESTLRDRQALEEKLVHLTQQIEFLTRKLQICEQENYNLKAVHASIIQILEEWAQITVMHNNFTVMLESLQKKLASTTTVVTSTSSQVTQSVSYKGMKSSGYLA